MRKIRLRKTVDDRLAALLANDLNPAQRDAATAPDGFNLILAGPGSGKTRVITYRVAYLIAKGVPAEQILLVTFTRRAAREMMSRLESLVGPSAAKVWAGTFHHIGNRILRRSAATLGYGPNFTILDGEDQADLVRLAMEDAGISSAGKMAPKPATVLHLMSFAANVRRPLAEVIAVRAPDLAEWTEPIEAVRVAYAARKLASNSMDYDDLLLQWGRLIAEFPEQKAAQGRMFQHLLVDEMQDTNSIQIELVESIARAGAGNLTAVGDDAQSIYKFRGANYDNILHFPDRNPGTRVYRLEVNYRSTPEIVAFTNASIAHNQEGFPKTLVSAREPGGVRPLVVPASDSYEESEFLCQQILDLRDEGVGLGKMAVLYRNHHDSILLQGELVTRGVPYSVRSGQRFFEQAHIKDVLAFLRIVVNPLDEPAWRRLLLLIPGIGPAKAAALWTQIAATKDPMAAIATGEAMAIVPAKSKGFLAGFIADVRKIQGTNPEAEPAAAIGAILQGGYPATVKVKYERPENRLADIEQMAVLAARYQSLEQLIADLLLAGDVYGMDTLDSQQPTEMLVLSTIHQAKGLEWSRVFIPRLIEESFPNYRGLNEPGGEDEERRIFYVAVTRAMDELYLTYPAIIQRGGRGAYMVTTPSRFLKEVPDELLEQAVIETAHELAWATPPPEVPEDDAPEH
ncbi:ATP-dependent helicase [Isosphaeraceae bacterium EP7]